MINAEFDFLIKEYGAPKDPVRLPEEQLQALEGRLPPLFIEFCRQFGFGSWGHGIFRFCPPDDFASIVETVFHGDPDLAPADCAAFGYTAFCELLLWHRVRGWVKADLVYKDVYSSLTANQRNLDVLAKLGPDRAIAASLMSVVEDSERIDDDEKPLFARARKQLGTLQPGECYGFVPAIGIGGTAKLQYLRRVRALEHFAIIAGLDSFDLLKVEDLEIKYVRRIGG